MSGFPSMDSDAAESQVELDITELVHRALQPKDAAPVERILALRAETAQRVLDYMQKKLEATAPYRALNQETDMSTYRSRIRSLMMKLAFSSRQLPESLFLQGVECDSLDAVAEGTFSDIYKGSYQGTAVALKRLRVFHLVNDTKAALWRESLLWRNLEHRHVLPFLGIEGNNFKGTFCMVLPWISEGNIVHFLNNLRDSGYPLGALNLQADKWFGQIAYGLAYLHSEEIVHGDLRGANVLIDSDWDIKLADFGLSILAEGGGISSSLRGGGARWLAPELMIPTDCDATRPTYSSDIYSLACVSIELYTGLPPFFGMSEAQTIMSVMDGKRPSRPQFLNGELMRPFLWALVSDCWHTTPSVRPTAESVVKRLMSDSSHSTMMVTTARPKRSHTTEKCLLSECPKAANRRLGIGQYCSSAHELVGYARSGCLLCRRSNAVEDDLCVSCRIAAQQDAPFIFEVPYDHVLFESVSNRFRHSWGRNNTACPTLRTVYKIVTEKTVSDRYRAYRASVEGRGQFVRLGQNPGNETLGWHGTRRVCDLGNDGHTSFCSLRTCSLCGIVRHSFDVTYGSSGLGFGLGWEILGKGIYTSSSSSKSDKYAYNESWSTPLKAMLLNKVVMGRCYVVDSAEGTLIGPPPGYDSARLSQAAAVDDIAVYRNDAIKPSFLVTYSPCQ